MNRCLKIGFILIITGLTIFLKPLPYAEAFSMNVDPPRLELSIAPGESKSGTIKLSNKGESSIRMKAYAQDWIYDPPGNRVFRPPATTPFSCSTWIYLYPEELEIQPGETAEVLYTLTVPQNATGGHYAVIFFEGIAGESKTEEGLLVKIAGRIGTIVYQETEGTIIRKGTISSLEVSRPDENKPLDIELSFKNEGNVFLAPQGVVNILDKEGNFFGRQEFKLGGALPGDVIEGKVSLLSKLPQNEYDVIVTLDLKGDEAVVEEVNIIVAQKGEITKFDVAVFKNRTAEFSLDFNNSGNLNIEIDGEIEILDRSGQKIDSLAVEKVLVLPDSQKQIITKVEQKLLPGTYKARAALTFNHHSLYKEIPFSVK